MRIDFENSMYMRLVHNTIYPFIFPGMCTVSTLLEQIDSMWKHTAYISLKYECLIFKIYI